MRGGYHIRISVSKLSSSASTSGSYQRSHLESTGFVPSSIFEPLPAHPPKQTARRYTFDHPREQTTEDRQRKDYRYGPLRVDWVDFDSMDLTGAGRATHSRDKSIHVKGLYFCRGCLRYDIARCMVDSVCVSHFPFPVVLVCVNEAASCQERWADRGRGVRSIWPVSNICTTGGPATGKFLPARTKSGSTNLPEGVVRIYRELPRDAGSSAGPSTSTQDPPTVPSQGSDGVIMGVLAVPSWMTPSDFLAFVAPAAEGMAHLRIIRYVVNMMSAVSPAEFVSL